MLMRVETRGLAMVVLLAAAFGAAWMAYGIIRSDHRSRRPG
jgi:hypothetical protein